MERDMLYVELNSIGNTFSSDRETPSIAAKSSKMIWKHNTDLDAPYRGGNFNFLYNPGANEATITFTTYFSYRGNYTNAQKQTLIENLQNAINAWDSAAELQIRDNSGAYMTKIKLRFMLQIVQNSKFANKKTDVHPTDTWSSWFNGKNREIVMRDLNIFIGSSYETLCHELGHVWGVKDEYKEKGAQAWVERKFSPAHVGTDSPLLKDENALMNKGYEFRGRYFKHLGRALLKSFMHIPEFRKPIVVGNKTVAYQVIGRIALLKKHINGGTPDDFHQFNPQYIDVIDSFRNKNNEIANEFELESPSLIEKTELVLIATNELHNKHHLEGDAKQVMKDVTDTLFWKLHPDWKGKKLKANSPIKLRKHWIELRDEIVKPLVDRFMNKEKQDEPLKVDLNEVPAMTFGSLNIKGELQKAQPIPLNIVSVYSFSRADLLWTARYIMANGLTQAGTKELGAVWTRFNLFAAFMILKPHYWASFGEMLRVVLRSQHPNIYHKSMTSQWMDLDSNARNLAIKFLTGKALNPGIGNAMYFYNIEGEFMLNNNEKKPNEKERQATLKKIAGENNRIWVGVLPNIDQSQIAFFSNPYMDISNIQVVFKEP